MKKSIVLNLINLVILSSCASWVESAKKMIDQEEVPEEKKKVQWVSKAQYDDLLLKYNNLNEENAKLKETKQEMKRPYDQIDELSNTVEASDSIDVFAEEQIASKIENTQNLSNKNIANLVNSYEKAIAFKNNGKLKAALGIFQFLEKSNVEQVVVRAKYQIGQIYYNQNQFDLSLQVYESIIANNSYSSIVLNALKGAILSSKNLGLKDKEVRYSSVLKDFFGINS